MIFDLLFEDDDVGIKRLWVIDCWINFDLLSIPAGEAFASARLSPTSNLSIPDANADEIPGEFTFGDMISFSKDPSFVELFNPATADSVGDIFPGDRSFIRNVS